MTEVSGRSVFVAVAITVGAAVAAGAQTCVGNAPFSAGPVRLSADFAFPNNAKSYGGTAAFGTATPGLFGRVEGSALRFDHYRLEHGRPLTSVPDSACR